MRAEDLVWIILTSAQRASKQKGVMVYHRVIYAVCMVQHSKELEDAAAQGGARRSVPACVLHRLRWLCCSCLDDFSQGCHASDGLAIRLPRGNNDLPILKLDTVYAGCVGTIGLLRSRTLYIPGGLCAKTGCWATVDYKEQKSVHHVRPVGNDLCD